MKNLLKSVCVFAFVATSLTLTSCGSENNDLIDGPDSNTKFNLIINPTNSNNVAERNLNITVTPNVDQKVNVSFTSNENMYRLYVTKNVFGSDDGAIAYEKLESIGIDTKRDGSIDLGSNQKTNFTFNIDFDSPTALDQTVQYKLWVTTGRGDFRDVSKRNAIDANAFGTITLKGGVNADTNVQNLKSFSATILNAPLAEGTSESFISIFNGVKYKITTQDVKDINTYTFTAAEKEENAENAALWDFGYFYGNTKGASFASASNYPSDVIDINKITGLTSTQLNKCYMVKSSLTTAQFDAISAYAELNSISKPSTERVTGLVANDVIEFVDAYGNKGLIKITEIKTGFTGSIKFDVKVQVNAEPIKG